MHHMRTVTNYKVGICRSVHGGPARWLTLELSPSDDPVKRISLFFYEKPAGKFGFVNRATGFVVVNLPLADFDPLYKVVNTERPVYAHWRSEAGEEKIISIDVSTSEEPIGEGPVDHSP
jgi:hypothetical protein